MKTISAWPLLAVAVLLLGAGMLAHGSSSSSSSDSGWKTLHEERFESRTLPSPAWERDTYPDDGPFSDNDAFFAAMHAKLPEAYRLSAPFGEGSWLTVESYTRNHGTAPSELFSIADDPAGGGNHVLRIHSPRHTDATVIRPTHPLPRLYRICTRVGYADFGSGKADPADLNGYAGGERSEPWFDTDATGENGFYWLAILDHLPRPHNNVWAHHHRKVVIDSDNNKAAWTEIWDGSHFHPSGEHPVMMFGLDREGADNDRIGKPFISFSAGKWQPSGAIRAVDAYLDGHWYTACVTRTQHAFSLTVTGEFKYGGARTYSSSIDLERVYRATDSPDWFMFGDPHENFYRGQVFYDDIRLEVPAN